jgi:hypothetical protein
MNWGVQSNIKNQLQIGPVRGPSHLWKLCIPNFKAPFDEDALKSSHTHFVTRSNQSF